MTVMRKQRGRLAWLVALVLVIGAAALGYIVLQSRSDNNNNSANSNAKVEQPKDQQGEVKQESPRGTTIKTGDSQYGTMLFDDRGQAIYIWQREDSATAKCYGDCAKEWPPVLTSGAPVATGEVNSKLLGTTKRTDGTTQVTYNGHPLYFYAHEGVGQVECHNISTHGGLWWVIQPNGTRAK